MQPPANEALRELERTLHAEIPLTRAMGVRVAHFDATGLTLRAPLEPNINHKSTAFGGSLATLATLAGWGLLQLLLREQRLMCDGATIETISNDINSYWDENDSRYIPTNRQSESVGWYDPKLGVYKLLISSGATATTHNVELEYSFKHKEWTKLYRESATGANPLQLGFTARDANGLAYTYGANNSGYLYRLEYGKTWAGTPIAQYVWTKDLLPDGEMPLFKHTVIKYVRLLYENKSGAAASEDVSFTHYCDSTTATVDGSNNQKLPTAIDINTKSMTTRSCVLGPCLRHSFKLSISTSNVYDGVELLGLGIYFDSLEGVREN